MPLRMTKEAALAFMLENSFSKAQYMNIRLNSKYYNADIYPPYEYILEAKKDCQVSPLEVSDTCAQVPLFCLVDHTIRRIALLQSEVLETFFEGKCKDCKEVNAEMTFRYGFDGTTSQSTYCQKFQSSHESSSGSDSSLFATTLVPLRLTADSGDILWVNRTPQSVRFCRPIKLQFAKASKELVMAEKEELDEQIGSLERVTIKINDDQSLVIQPRLKMTLVDGKILNYLTTRYQRKRVLFVVPTLSILETSRILTLQSLSLVKAPLSSALVLCMLGSGCLNASSI
nr:PREDICTED: uncharacterized protein LOC109034777 isoform X1 [Bemisia tabaci]